MILSMRRLTLKIKKASERMPFSDSLKKLHQSSQDTAVNGQQLTGYEIGTL